MITRRNHRIGINNLRANPNRKFRIEEKGPSRNIKRNTQSDGEKLLQELKKRRNQEVFGLFADEE